jgi:hypothetical protein
VGTKQANNKVGVNLERQDGEELLFCASFHVPDESGLFKGVITLSVDPNQTIQIPYAGFVSQD